MEIAAVEATPSAVWFTSGTPADVQRAAHKTAAEVKAEKRVPIMVAYNVPFRDCAQYSAGGALDTAAYEQWIDGFAAGIGDAQAVVILEPDGLGLIPYNTTIFSAAEWCQPRSRTRAVTSPRHREQARTSATRRSSTRSVASPGTRRTPRSNGEWLACRMQP